MPLERCQVNGRKGWRWGNRGRCYTGEGSVAKALSQARAIKASQTRNFDPNQPRDELGQWTDTGEGGRCYEQAGKLLMSGSSEIDEWEELKLVQGYPTGTGGNALGKKYGHSWVEGKMRVEGSSLDMVRDPSIGVSLPKAFYYQLGNIDPSETRSYTRAEAGAEMLRTGHWGPWGEVPPDTVFNVSNFDPDQPRDKIGRWVDVDGPDLPPRVKKLRDEYEEVKPKLDAIMEGIEGRMVPKRKLEGEEYYKFGVAATPIIAKRETTRQDAETKILRDLEHLAESKLRRREAFVIKSERQTEQEFSLAVHERVEEYVKDLKASGEYGRALDIQTGTLARRKVQQMDDDTARRFGIRHDIWPTETIGDLDDSRPFRDGADYRNTRAVTRLLQNRRFSQIMEERGLGRVDADTMSQAVWGGWKTSSTSAMGTALQAATVEEFEHVPAEQFLGPDGARRFSSMDMTRAYDGFADTARMAGHPDPDASEGARSGLEIMKAYSRATWESSQYTLDKAGVDRVSTYRALVLKNSVIASADPEMVVGRGSKLTDFQYLPNGAQSATTLPSVANTWQGVGDKRVGGNYSRVVLKSNTYRESMLSIPAHGLNEKLEEEVVLGPIGWRENVTAWVDIAPTTPPKEQSK